MAISDYQNECYRVVTIDYLKKFIKDGSTYLIQNSTGGTVDVNLNALSSEKRRDDYCPTFGELTANSLIQTWLQGSSSPNSDRDGIVVSSVCKGTGAAYSNNQLVNQADLSLIYTRFSGLTISAAKTINISECGESISISYSHKYIRRTKSMNNNCVVPSTPSSAETSSTVCGELTWHTDFSGLTNSGSSISSCSTYTINKNGTISALARTDNVYATVKFRGTSHDSNTLQMKQNALTGSYSVADTNNPHYTGVTASTTDATEYNDCSSHNFSITAIGGYYNRYYWKENTCNVIHYDVYNDVPGTEDVGGSSTSCSISGPNTIFCEGTADFSISSGGGSGSVDSGSFDSVDCCDGTTSDSKRLYANYHGLTDSILFTRTCQSCASSSACNPPAAKEYPTNNTATISTDSGHAAESYASDAGYVDVEGDASIDRVNGVIWTNVSVAGHSYGDYLGEYTVTCTNTEKYYSGYTVKIYYHNCPGSGCV